MITILIVRDSLCAVISYYGGIPTVFIELCNKYKGNFNELFGIGYICDWRNRKEYRLVEYIDKYHNHDNIHDIKKVCSTK